MILASIHEEGRSGTSQTVKLFGINLPHNLTAEAVSLGTGVSIQSLSQQANDTLVLEVRVDAQAEPGVRAVTVQGVSSKLSLAVYKTIDYIRLSPEHGFARPGGERGPKIFQQFEVEGYSIGADGKKGTADDVKLGRVTQVKWKVEEYVKRMNDDDITFVGRLDDAGLFTPALDGPNPQRHMSEGNVKDGLEYDRLNAFINNAHLGKKTVCQTCWVRGLCGGGCYHEAMTQFGDALHPNLHYCDFLRAWTEYGIRVYMELQQKTPGFVEQYVLRGRGDTPKELT